MGYPLRTKQILSREGAQKVITVSNAAMLTLFSVPVVLMTASTNTQLALVPLEIYARISAGTAYASFNNMTISYVSGNTIAVLPGTGFLDQTVATGVVADPFTSATGVVVKPNAGIQLQMGTGDPTTGTSPVVIRIKYKLHRVV
jgi:hypothetical protein